MRIINVLEMMGGIPEFIQSFPIYEEQLSEEVVEQAENFFISRIHEFYTFEDDENKEQIIQDAIDNGSFETSEGVEIYIIWSDID